MEKKEKENVSIYEAFKNAQKGFKPLLKDAVNPFYKSKYASLSAVLDSVMESLNDNGLSLKQSVEDGQMVTTVYNEVGESIISKRPFIIPKKVVELVKGQPELVDETDPQAIGKVESYARRYGLQLALGLSAEDDDVQSVSHLAATKPAESAKPSQQAKRATSTTKTTKTLEEIGRVEGVTVTEDDNLVAVSGKTFSLSADLRALGFAWDGKTKTWNKSKYQSQSA